MTDTFTSPWEQFKRPFVRDLAYAIACPDILNDWVSPDKNLVSPVIKVHSPNFWQHQFQNYQQRLYELDTTKGYQDLTRYLMSRPSPYRLGFHFEGLIHFWLEDGFNKNIHPYQVLAHNVQLYNGSQTTGELDFILRNHADEVIEHWELAIKFYLGSAPYDFVNWVGINSRDNLERKLIHMQTKPFRSVWIDLDFYDKVKIDRRYAVIKGRFFKPNHQPFESPNWLNNSFPMHIWYEINDSNDFESFANSSIRPTHYIEWLTHRPFYDASYINRAHQNTRHSYIKTSKEEPSNKIQKRQKHAEEWPYSPLAFEDIETNLYMLDGEPIVFVKK